MKLLRWIQRSRREDAEAETAAALAAKIEASVEHKAALDRDTDAKAQAAVISRINYDNHFSAKLTRIYRGEHA